MMFYQVGGIIDNIRILAHAEDFSSNACGVLFRDDGLHREACTYTGMYIYICNIWIHAVSKQPENILYHSDYR